MFRHETNPIELIIGNSGQVLVLDKPTLRRMHRYRQVSRNALEAGGQLFARFEHGRVFVSEATGPRRRDVRTRTSYVPDRVSEQREIDARHKKGLHYVGDWHTHPEREPQPSGRDFESIKDCFLKSRHHLNAFVFVVVGTSDDLNGMHVSLHDGGEPITLLGRGMR